MNERLTLACLCVAYLVMISGSVVIDIERALEFKTTFSNADKVYYITDAMFHFMLPATLWGYFRKEKKYLFSAFFNCVAWIAFGNLYNELTAPHPELVYECEYTWAGAGVLTALMEYNWQIVKERIFLVMGWLAKLLKRAFKYVTRKLTFNNGR